MSTVQGLGLYVLPPARPRIAAAWLWTLVCEAPDFRSLAPVTPTVWLGSRIWAGRCLELVPEFLLRTLEVAG